MYHLFFALSFFIFFLASDFKINISSCSACFFHFIITYGFYNPQSNFHHALYISLWPILLAIVALLSKNNTWPWIFKKNISNNRFVNIILLTPLIILATYTFYALLKNYLTLKLFKYTAYQIRDLVHINYITYLYSKSLFLILAFYALIRVKNIFYKIALFFVSLFIASYTMYKTPFVYLFIGTTILYYVLIRKNFFTTLKHSFFLFTILFVAVVIFVKVFNIGFKNLSPDRQYIKATSARIFSSVAKRSFLSMQQIEKTKKLGLGRNSFSLLFKNKKKEEDLSKIAYKIYTKTKSVPKRASANTPCLIPLYLDFRFFGLFFAILLGYFLRLYDNTIQEALRRSSNWNKSLCLCSYITSMLLVLQFNMTTFGTTLLSGGTAFAILITLLCVKYELIFCKKNKDNMRI